MWRGEGDRKREFNHGSHGIHGKEKGWCVGVEGAKRGRATVSRGRKKLNVESRKLKGAGARVGLRECAKRGRRRPLSACVHAQAGRRAAGERE